MTSPRLIIEICPREPRASACLPNGNEVCEDSEVSAALADCRASGDVQDACEFVRDVLKVDWRIVALKPGGGATEYENREATAAEKAETCRAIYFDSQSDFDDESTAETYLIWEAASEFDQ